MFDTAKRGSIEKEKVRTILTTLGHSYDDKELEQMLSEEDPEGEFRTIVSLALNRFDKTLLGII